MTQQQESMSRIEAYLPFAACEAIDRAAAMQGRSRTDFLIEATLEKARALITEQTLIDLTQRDQELLAAALLEGKTAEPTPFLMNLAKDYKSRVRPQ